MALSTWAVPKLTRLLPLDENSVKEIITYTETLPKQAAAEHLKNLLGDSAQAFEFIASFNSRRQEPPLELTNTPNAPRSSNVSEASRTVQGLRKKKQPFNKLPPPREPQADGHTSGAYMKKSEDEYMAGNTRPRKKEAILANTLALQAKPDAMQLPTIVGAYSIRTSAPKLPPSAAGALISDSEPSRSSSPMPTSKTKINVSGGTSMRGQSATINDLDSAIRALETQTNPSLASKQDDAKRRCNCMAQRHPLLTAAPNCLNCGKIICTKEGIGPCTFCGTPLLSPPDIQAMISVLRSERGKERLQTNNLTYKRADVAKTPRPFSSRATTPVSSAPTSDSETEKLSAAKQHRDRLLKYQADNARRTRIHDEAADFDTPESGQSMWATPQERALQLKRQQKVLREQEWSARPEYEKRKMVVSLDVSGGKAVKRMVAVERPVDREMSEGEEEIELSAPPLPSQHRSERGGTFSRNPLLGSLIRPVYDSGGDKGKERLAEKRSTWRRVQDDMDDNEEWILDGGVYGGASGDRALGSEEHAFG